MKLTERKLLNHSARYDGYCTTCDKFTRKGETEPDAENYPCPKCKQNTCMGAEQALITGALELT